MPDSNPSSLSQMPPITEQISTAIDRLRQLSQTSIQDQWRLHLGDLPLAEATQFTAWQQWTIATLNDRGHIAWKKGRQVLWLGQRLTVPSDLNGYLLEGLLLRLSLTWWAEAAQVFVNGALVQEGDLFDHSARILLAHQVVPGESIDLAIRLVSPGHDNGALVRSICIYELPDQTIEPCAEPGFVADELAVLQTYLIQFAPEQLENLATAIDQIPWSQVIDRSIFDQALSTLRQQLHPLSNWVRQRKIQLVGHAHLDLAWLWAVEETWKAAERTFKSVLNLQKDFPDLTFCHSTPALYAWVEANRPDLFVAIQNQIQTGQWEVVAGLWVEPELNVVSGESIARQVLYGQRYVAAKFGEINKIAWLPDTFGFCWQLPQILKQGGIEYFVTQKLRWNDSTQFPYDWFWWQSPDGSRILSLNSAPIGEGIDPVKMADYTCTWEQKTNLQTALWLPGVGDHGGGPTRDMLELAQRWQRSPFFPQLEFTTVLQFLQQAGGKSVGIREFEGQKTEDIPVWNDELYLEFHRGCYTTHADQKQFNRHCERLLYEAEWFASIATLTTGASYPQTEIEAAWKQVLFNQFHDILPGSAIPEVYEDADREWKAAAQTCQRIVLTALKEITSHIKLPTPPHPNAQAVVVFNSLNWERSCRLQMMIVQPEDPDNPYHSNWHDLHWQICDLEGHPVPYQHCPPAKPNRNRRYIYFLAENIPAAGYRTFWLIPSPSPHLPISPPPTLPNTLENEFLRVTVDPATGDLSSVFDKTNQREVLSGAGNQLQAFRDAGQYWDAWNIDPNYQQHLLPLSELISIEPCWREEERMFQTCLKVKRKVSKSIVLQRYILEQGSPVLKIRTIIHPNEEHILIKAAFPLNLEADHATYEIPFGAIQRTTRPQTDHEKAKWEVPALNWADLSDDNYGVSILSDCKHGYDAQPNQLRITLFRRPTFPDPYADSSPSSFTYALYPHAGSWQTAQTVQHGYELNQPVTIHRVVKLDPQTQGNNEAETLPPIGQFFSLDAANLVLSAFKRSEDNPQQWILRCYEAHGETATLDWRSVLNNSILGQYLNSDTVTPTNLLEQPDSFEGIESNGESWTIAPWKIITVRIDQQ